MCRQGGGQDWGGLVDVDEEAESLEGRHGDAAWDTGVNELQEMEVGSSYHCAIVRSRTCLGLRNLEVLGRTASLHLIHPSIVLHD